jgi:hypothetical protein
MFVLCGRNAMREAYFRGSVMLLGLFVALFGRTAWGEEARIAISG